jgi:hypothetical protein
VSHPAGPREPLGPQQPYPQQPYGQPPAAMWPTEAVTVTRQPFDHSRHIKRTVITCGLWGLVGYLPAWLWNRFGPEKSVSVTRFR